MLDELPRLIEANGIKGPALLIIGEVTALRAPRVAASLSIEEVVTA
jgi:siroheme synthase